MLSFTMQNNLCIMELLFEEVFCIKLFKNNNFYSKNTLFFSIFNSPVIQAWYMNCFTAHFQTLFQYFFWKISYSFEHLFCPFHTYISFYFLQNCILFTLDAANFIPDTIILNLEAWHLNFIGFLICPHSLIWDNIWAIKLSNENQMLDQNHQNLTPFYLYLVKLHKTYQEIEIKKR